MSMYVTSFEWTGEDHDLLVLRLNDGSRKVIPKESIEFVGTATREDAENIEIIGDGEYLHWPSLDFDLHVPPLLEGVYGSAKWMSHLGRQGGRARTARKADAARANGKLGGRPRKCQPEAASAAVINANASSYGNCEVTLFSWQFAFPRERFAEALVLPPGAPVHHLPSLRV